MPDPIISAATDTTYLLVSWVRRGMASLVTGQPATNYASLAVQVKVNDTAVNAPAVRLLGPGDVTGLDARAVIRTDPRNLADSFEPNYLAMVELSSPDLPWMFTPAGVNGEALQPWICLVVVPEGAGVALETRAGGLNVLTIGAPLNPNAELPDLKSIGFWAHAQVTGTATTDATAFDGDPAYTLSRLISPRRLEADTAYLACIVPTYHAGVNAAFGLAVDDHDLAPAWSDSEGPTVSLPVYYSFRFWTGPGGDFASLARSITASADATAGTRPMGVDEPGFGVEVPSLAGLTLGLEGALRTVDPTVSDPDAFQPEPWPTGAAAVYGKALLESLAPLAPIPPAIPMVTPPTYGGAQSGKTLGDAATPLWLSDLNLDPRTRAAAAAGTQIVEKNRDALVASAWEQVGDVRGVNRMLHQGQFAQEVSGSLLRRHLAAVDTEGAMLQVTAPLHSRVKVAATGVTLRASIAASVLPNASVSATMRKLTRPKGLLGRQLRAGGVQVVDGLNAAPGNKQALRVATPILAPRGMVAFDAVQPKSDFLQISKMKQVFEGSTGSTLKTADHGAVDVQRSATLTPGDAPRASVASFAHWSAGLAAFSGDRSKMPTSLTLPADAATLSVMQGQFQAAAGSIIQALGTAPVAAALPASLAPVKETLRLMLDPKITILARLRLRIPVGSGPDPLQPIRVAPQFPSGAMYKPLADLSPEWMLPGIASVPIDSATLLEPNARFIESYMVGLNEELARELLWQQYPADLQFTYFQSFWDSSVADIPPIQSFDATKRLGQHVDDLASGKTAVLLIRANLFRRYPNAIVALVQAAWTDSPKGKVRTLSGPLNYPQFRGEIGADVTFFGFDLTKLLVADNPPKFASLRGPADLKGADDPAAGQAGWYFVIEQHITEPRFGLEPAKKASPTTWEDMSWDDLPKITMLDPKKQPTPAALEGVTWGSDAAAMAFILLREPVRVALHARALLGTPVTKAVNQ